METRVDKVAEKHKSGYNCAQAVACAYCDLVGIWCGIKKVDILFSRIS